VEKGGLRRETVQGSLTAGERSTTSMKTPNIQHPLAQILPETTDKITPEGVWGVKRGRGLLNSLAGAGGERWRSVKNAGEGTERGKLVGLDVAVEPGCTWESSKYAFQTSSGGVG